MKLLKRKGGDDRSTPSRCDRAKPPNTQGQGNYYYSVTFCFL